MRRLAGAGVLVGVFVALALPGHAAAISASPPSVSFGNVPINTTVSQAVTITVDTGYRTEIASGAGLNPPFGFDFDTCGAGGGFAGPGTCTVTQRFTPTSVGSFNANTTVFECPIAGGSCLPVTFGVHGAGISQAAANPASIDFGNVPINTTVSRDVTITVDTGYRTEIASGSGINVPFGFDFDTCGAGGGFAGPGTCNIKERYTPTSVGPSSGSTTVFECPIVGGSCIPINFSVQGAGVSAAAANPASIDFGNVPINTTVSQAVTITVDTGYRTEIASGRGDQRRRSGSTSTPAARAEASPGPAPAPSPSASHRPASAPSAPTRPCSSARSSGGSCIADHLHRARAPGSARPPRTRPASTSATCRSTPPSAVM